MHHPISSSGGIPSAYPTPIHHPISSSVISINPFQVRVATTPIIGGKKYLTPEEELQMEEADRQRRIVAASSDRRQRTLAESSTTSIPVHINSTNEADVRALDEPLRERFLRREPMTGLYPHCLELASNESWWDIMMREPLYTTFYEYLAQLTPDLISSDLLSLICEQQKQAAYYATLEDAIGTLHFTIVDTYHVLTSALSSPSMTSTHSYESDMRGCSFREVEMDMAAHAYADHLNEAPTRLQLRTVAKELATLSRTLPISSTTAAIVRISNQRPNFLSFLITGAVGTPYAYGCFIFDVYFPPTYPNVPPKCRMRTPDERVRFNPHIYESGNICLSLLGTHPGPGWDPKISTCLQVINSIQALLLVEQPWCEFDTPTSLAAASAAVRSGVLSLNLSTKRHTMEHAILGHLQRIYLGITSYNSIFDDAIITHFRYHKAAILKAAQELGVPHENMQLVANL